MAPQDDVICYVLAMLDEITEADYKIASYFVALLVQTNGVWRAAGGRVRGSRAMATAGGCVAPRPPVGRARCALLAPALGADWPW